MCSSDLDGDDLAGALLLAHDWKKPLLFAPAMNPAMWSHPATVASVERLRGWGARFVSPGAGRTATQTMHVQARVVNCTDAPIFSLSRHFFEPATTKCASSATARISLT